METITVEQTQPNGIDAGKKRVELNELSDRAFLKIIYEQTAKAQELQNQFNQTQEVLRQLNLEGKRRAAEGEKSVIDPDEPKV